MKTYKQFQKDLPENMLWENPLLNWFNKGKNTRIPNEAQASWRQLFDDDLSQRQRISADPKSAWNPVRGMPGYGSAKSVINPRIRAINTRRRSMGKPPLSMDKINPGGFQTGPTPIQREIIKRPIRAAKSGIRRLRGGGGLFGGVETIPTSSSPNSLSGILQKSRSKISPGDMMHRGGV